MESSESGRPAKKARIEDPEDDAQSQGVSKDIRKERGRQAEYKRQQRRAELDHPQPESTEHRRDRELFGIDEDNEQEIGLKPLQDEERQKLRKRHVPKTFSQPSVISVGDKGIFVTCDKGREKKCLMDLADLVEDYLEKHGLIPAELVDPDAMLQSRLDRQQLKSATIPVDNEDSPVEEEEIDIESSINTELSTMQGGPGMNPAKESTLKMRAFQLITLDVPCVSFLRFVPNSRIAEEVEVVGLVHSICADAAENPGRMRSRYIKRLSPVVWLGKVLNDGLEKACEKILPAHFRLEQEGIREQGNDREEKSVEHSQQQGVTFAIKPTIRNNDKVSRDDIIKKVAEEVQRLGNRKHKVDLKGYQKGIMIEIYRGWIGMSVVDNDSATQSDSKEAANNAGREIGYEALKRFNLSEIYAEGLKKETRP